MLSKPYILRVVKRFLRSLPIEVKYAILFGSTVYGERLEDSDIDLIIVSEDFRGVPFERRIMLLQKLWKHKVPLEAFAFTPDEIEILKNKSIVIQEALEKGEMILLRAKARVGGKYEGEPKKHDSVVC